MRVYREITPLSDSDVFVLLDSVDQGFDYPIHNHPEFEINLVMGSAGMRIVGDSAQPYRKNDLVLLGPYLFHKWDDSLQEEGYTGPCRVITLQFDSRLFDQSIFIRKPFHIIRTLLERSTRGIRFTGRTLEEAKHMMITLTRQRGMESVITFLTLMNYLADSDEYVLLASEGFDQIPKDIKNKRLHAVYHFLINNFTDQTIKMHDVAAQVGLSDSAFSHFFKKNTQKSFTQFLVELRLGHACKLLVETDDLIGTICFEAGFNNVANFNRLFKKYQGCTPLQFRKRYHDKTGFDWNTQRTPGQFIPAEKTYPPEYKPTDYGTTLIHA